MAESEQDDQDQGKGRKARDDNRPAEEIRTELLEQLVRELRHCDDFALEAEENYRYYYAHQGEWETEPDLFSINVNQTRGSTDRKVAKLLDSQAEMEIEGRGGHVLSGAEEWDDFLDWQRRWTGDFNDAWVDHLPKIVFQAKCIGEGIAEARYDFSEENGRGMVVLKYDDACKWVWSSDATSAQLRDAELLFCFEPKRVSWLKEEYPDYAEEIHAQGSDWIQGQLYKGLDSAALDAIEGGPVGDDYESAMNQFLSENEEPIAWHVRRWWKKRQRVKVYFDKQTRRPAMRPDDKAEGEVPIDEKWIRQTGDSADNYDVRTVTKRVIWETTLAGAAVVRHRISTWDRDRGGCGQFPIARLPNIWDPRRPKAHGDVEYERSYDDLMSNTATRWVEALFIGNAHWVDTVRGAYAPQEEYKLETLGERSFQKIARYPGMPAAQIMGVQSQGPNLFAAGMNFLQELADDARRVYQVNKGGMPYETSGRGIRQLLAEAAVIENLDRDRMTSFLRQESYLRIALSQQWMGRTAYRLLPINRQSKGRKYLLAVGDNRERIVEFYGLEELFKPDQSGQTIDPKPTGLYRRMNDPHGEIVRILAMDEFNEPGRLDVRMRLSSGAERSKAEKLDLVEMFTKMAAGLPPEFVKWAAEVADAPNRDGLLIAADQVAARTDMTKQLEGMLKQFDLSWDEATSALQQIGQQKQAMMAAGQGNGAASPRG